MKRSRKIIAAFVLLSLVLSCSKDGPDRNALHASKKMTPIDTVWTAYLNEPHYTGLAIDPFIHENEVFINAEYRHSGLLAPFYGVNKKNGRRGAIWSGYLGQPQLYSGQDAIKVGNYMMIAEQNRFYCLNLEDMSTHWTKKILVSVPTFFPYQGDAYRGGRFSDPSRKNEAVINRFDLDDKKVETIFRYEEFDPSEGAPEFVGLTFGKMDNGDDVMVFKNRMDHSTWRDSTRIFAYNLSHDSLMWKSEKLESSTSYPMYLDRGELFVPINENLYKLDLETGEKLWELQVLDQPYSLAKLHFHNGLIYPRPYYLIIVASKIIYFVSKSSGKVTKQFDYDYYFEPDRIAATLDSCLIMSSDRGLSAINMYNGEDMLADYHCHDIGEIRSAIAVDEETRRIYYHNFGALICTQMPEFDL